MFSADLVSVYVAVLAVALAVVATMMLVRLRGVSTAAPWAPPAVASDAPRDVVSVTLVEHPSPTGGWSWRFELDEGTPATRVVIFSFRVRRDDGCGPWQHELVDSPLVLLPGRPAHLPAPPTVGARFDVSVAWTTEAADGPARGSRFLSLA